MIYFVDEDVAQLAAWELELKSRGYSVTMLRDADEGFRRLVTADDIQFVCIDVMLAVGENEGKSRYDNEQTEEYTLTGLFFLDDLVAQRPEIFPRRSALLTMTGSPRLLQLATEKCKFHSIPLLRKLDFATPFEFANVIEKLMGR